MKSVSPPHRRFRWFRKRDLIVLLVFILLLLASYWYVMSMPGSSHRGPLPALTTEQERLREELRRDLQALASDIGERNMAHFDRLQLAVDFIERAWSQMGHTVQRHAYRMGQREAVNLIVEIQGSAEPRRIVIVGAHYDSVEGSPGANDNASGVAAVLALSRMFVGLKPARTLRFAAFGNEEPPYFQSSDMGSLVYARACRDAGEDVAAMISFDGIGWYSDKRDSQMYPGALRRFFPSEGNFIAFVGNLSSRGLVRQSVGAFRRSVEFPSEGIAAPAIMPGIGWSDHWSFWKQGYPAVMVTDTLPFRYPYYHTPHDTPDKLDFDRMARVVWGMRGVVAKLADIE